MRTRLILVGNPETVHVGCHLRNAAAQLGLEVHFCDVREAFAAPVWRNRFNWWLRGRRPTGLREFSEHVVRSCQQVKPRWVLCTGIAPVEAWALDQLGRLGAERLNYLTDDPWNRAHRAPWFLKALCRYDRVFSTRRAVLADLRRAGCQEVSHLPFAYAPEIHFAEQTCDQREAEQLDADVLFVGGADRDRLPLITSLLHSDYRVALYGGYWERYRRTSSIARGLADPATLRKAVRSAKVTLCLVRRANRDGSAMRSFEVPAMGGCMLTEDTDEHREIFGPEAQAVMYFRDAPEMLEKLRWLLDHEVQRQRLRDAAQRLVTQGRHTYRDRLQTMLAIVPSEAACA
jgi:spore maturation protein CgeB